MAGECVQIRRSKGIDLVRVALILNEAGLVGSGRASEWNDAEAGLASEFVC